MRVQREPETQSVSGSVRPAALGTIVFLLVGASALLHCAAWQRAPATTHVKVYFDRYSAEATECMCKDLVLREIPKTKSIEEAAVLALKELIKGPTKKEYAQGYRGCLPGGGHIARYKETYMEVIQDYRQSGGEASEFAKRFLSPEGESTPWGDKVAVRGVKIKEGIAYADFSKELYSYGGGSCSVEAIQTGIKNTIKQFSEVEQVVILIEGREAEIQP